MATTSETAAVRTPPADRGPRLVAYALLVGMAVAFLVVSWSSITAPFGDSDDGINGAVWGADSQAWRELGLADSHMGGTRADGTKYANHPPLIVVEAYAAETLAGEHPWSTRAGAWLGALATIPLLYLLLKEIVGDEAVAASATAAALACRFLFVYGPMLDTMIIAFPLGVLVAWRWYREWRARGHTHWFLLTGLCIVASLGGWQATFLVGLCGLACLVRGLRGRGPITRAIPYLAGAVVATALTLLWARWVYGGTLGPLTDKLGRRSGESSGAGFVDMVTFQLPWLGQLLGVGLLACVACAVSIRDKRFRPIAVLSLATVVVYAFIFREGSGGHQYWNYWSMLPAAVGYGYAFGALATGLRRRRQAPRTTALVLAAITVLIGIVNLLQTNEAGALVTSGQRPLEVVQQAVTSGQLPADQTDLPYISEPYRADDWLRYASLPKGDPLLSRQDLETLARDHPDHLVLVLGECSSPDPTGLCDLAARLPAGATPPTLVPAAQLAQLLG